MIRKLASGTTAFTRERKIRRPAGAETWVPLARAPPPKSTNGRFNISNATIS